MAAVAADAIHLEICISLFPWFNHLDGWAQPSTARKVRQAQSG
jgi:hypothetical protein